MAGKGLNLFLYYGDEPIAATRHRFDDLLPAATVPNGFPHQPETLTQGRPARILLGPELRQEFFLWDHSFTVLHEVDEHLQGVRLQRAGNTPIT
jgi:hypothetical protein